MTGLPKSGMGPIGRDRVVVEGISGPPGVMISSVRGSKPPGVATFEGWLVDSASVVPGLFPGFVPTVPGSGEETEGKRDESMKKVIELA